MKQLNRITAAVVGTSGYAGRELAKILAKHRRVTLSTVETKCTDDKRLKPDEIADQANSANVVFLAVPKEEASILAPKIRSPLIDLSPAHRLDSDFVYGLPEVNKMAIQNATKIANPGCYATACLLGILPIAHDKQVKFVAFDCKSGYSGGGKTNKYNHDENVIPYGLNGHYQEKELAAFLGAGFSFVPHVVDAFNGILATIHIIGDFPALIDLYRAFYAKHPFVKVVEVAPDLQAVQGTPFCQIGGFVTKVGHTIVVSAIDNLLKGASSQAVQNMNLMFGFDEGEGLINYELITNGGFGDLDKEKIKELIEKSFGKKLAEDYFEHTVDKLVVETNYRGIAIIKSINGIPYMDKLAVVPELQGNGLAKAIMDELRQLYPALIWRAKTDNPINPWYSKNSDGIIKSKDGKWAIFWYGLETEYAYQLVAAIETIPETLVKQIEAA